MAVALTQELLRAGHGVDRAVSGDEAARMATDNAFQLVVLGHPLPGLGLARVVTAVRAPGSASRSGAVMVVSEPVHLAGATALVGRGVNRAFATTEHSEILVSAAFRLLQAGLPEAQRFSERLDVRLLVDGSWRPAHTENLSASGMLIATDADLPVGARFTFRFHLPGVEPVAGEAKVMRRLALPDRNRLGLGVRFCTFEGTGRQSLSRHLTVLRGSSEL